ncbi:hypothetical protein KJ885_03065 [Patescibacteria group bacterium]|nr:hypothetical protein [Patescibacteria group bacterium]
MKGLKIFLACAIGAFVGTLIALEMNRYFWWLGLLAGGLTGYLSYEFKTVLSTVPKAWSRATSWRPGEFFWQLVGASMVTLTVTITVELLVVLLHFSKNELLPSYGDIVALQAAVSVLYVLCLPMTHISLGATVYGKLRRERIEFYKKVALYGNPVAVFLVTPFLYAYFMVTGIWWLIKNIPAGICAIGRFVKHLFILIHSDARLLCGIDSAIGAAVGFFAGSALIGGLAGGVFGLINYEVVSKRLLHLHLSPK